MSSVFASSHCFYQLKYLFSRLLMKLSWWRVSCELLVVAVKTIYDFYRPNWFL